MTILEFEALLSDGVIHVPDEIAAKLGAGMALRVSVEPVTNTPDADASSDAAWASLLDFMHRRVAQGASTESYTWRREDAYTHLDKFDAPDSTR